MIRPVRQINVNSAARKVEVDNRFPIHVYYRIADNILRQANIYREEKNVVDLYIMLLRFSSLVSETIPFHRDYQNLLRKESAVFKKKLHAVLDELECLKPEFKLCINDLNKSWNEVQSNKNDGYYVTSTLFNSSPFRRPSNNNNAFVTLNDDKPVVTNGDNDHWKHVDRQSHKLSLSLPLPKKETLSRHSFLGPNGLAGQWTGPIHHMKVHYPNNTDLVEVENIRPSQIGEIVPVPEKENYSKSMEAVLSLDDGRWTNPVKKEIYKLDIEEKFDNMQFDIVRQPSPPPIPTKLQQDYLPISPSKVADPRPGPPSHSQDYDPNSGSYQDLHIPVKMMDEFLRLVRENTLNNLETCGVLAGSLKNRVFHITTLIIPKQESTSDSCQTLNEEEIFEAQDKFSLFPLGWIHTHPTQTCFMSSVDLHTHYSYQIMLPEAVAIVMAPSDTASPHGIFHLSDPGGVSVIRKCQQRGFHPHEEPTDGSHIYEKCSHVYINPSLNFDVVDLRVL